MDKNIGEWRCRVADIGLPAEISKNGPDKFIDLPRIMFFICLVIPDGISCGIHTGIVRLIIDEQKWKVWNDLSVRSRIRNFCNTFKPFDDIFEYALVFFDDKKPGADFRRHAETCYILSAKISAFLQACSTIRRDQ